MSEHGEKERKAVRHSAVSFLTKTAALSALGVILMYLNFPIIPGFEFLRMDFADIPALLGGFLINPFAAAIIAVVKALFTLFKTYSAGIGELSNLIVTLSFVLPASIVYYRKRTYKNALIGMALGIVVEAGVTTLSNYFFVYPMYLDLIGASFLNGRSMLWVILAVGLPFNLLKTVVASAVTLFLYKPLSKLFKRF